MNNPRSNPRWKRRAWITAGVLIGTTLLVGATIRHGQIGSRPIVVSSANGSGIHFTGKLDKTAVLAGSNGTVRLELTMAADDSELFGAARVPTDLVVILDRSGSMDGEKMEHARRAVHQLINELGAGDRFALVSYSDAARVDIPLSSRMGRVRQDWRNVVDNVMPGGGTNISWGLDVGLDLIDRETGPGRAARAILISDGLANQGDVTLSGLRRRALRAVQGEYVLSSVGVGDDFNEDLMMALANTGTGNYYYLQNGQSLASVFKDEFDSARETVATALAVQLAVPHGVQVLDAGGYPLERIGGATVFRPGSLFAGQERKVWVSLRFPTHAADELDVGVVSLAFSRNGARGQLTLDDLPRVACVDNRDTFLAAVDEDAWEQSVVQEEYNELQWKVGRKVKQGDASGALSIIRDFQSRNQAMNRTFGSAAVDGTIAESATLADEVERAFKGPNQEKKRKRLGKVRTQAGYDGRRAGSKR